MRIITLIDLIFKEPIVKFFKFIYEKFTISSVNDSFNV